MLRVRRRLVVEAMARAGIGDPPRVAARMYAGLGQGAVELLAGGRATIPAEAEAALDAALAAGPVVLFASHTGNWELAASAAARLLAARGSARLVIVAKPISDAGVDAWMAGLRASLGIATVAPAGALATALRALRRGDVVALPIDQVPDRTSHALRLPFLGEVALVDRAPATLAWRAKATVLVVAGERAEGETDETGETVVRVLDVVPPPAPHDEPRAWIEATTARATEALAAFVQARPESWLWLHRRWAPPRRRGRARRLVASGHPG